jgi:serine/threonine protein kinase
MAVDAARAKSLFLAASDLADLAERGAFLDRECGGDAELRARVDALLRANDAAPLPVAPGATVDSADGQQETGDYGDPTAAASTAEMGTRVKYFGDYELLEEIAHGGMGVVWKARQTSLKREVALKMIRSGALASPEEVVRFLREAQAAAHLQHPNIVAIHEVGEHDGQHYFSMDYVAGRDLGDFVKDGPLSPQTAARYVKIVAEAVHFAHQRGTLHRDLKPQNVLIDAADQPRITDFGYRPALAHKCSLRLGFQDS